MHAIHFHTVPHRAFSGTGGQEFNMELRLMNNVIYFGQCAELGIDFSGLIAVKMGQIITPAGGVITPFKTCAEFEEKIVGFVHDHVGIVRNVFFALI